MTDPVAVYIVAGCAALAVGIIVMIIMTGRNSFGRNFFDEQLEEFNSYGEVSESDKKVDFFSRWNRYWAVRFKGMGWRNYADENSKAGRDAALAGLGFAVIATIITRNPLVSIALSAGLMYVASLFMSNRGNKKSEAINNQLPGFLFALKSNVQANETPESAVLKIIDRTPSPLYEDLIIVKQRLLANATFKEAISELGERTSSRDLRFLCACMVQASESGTNLEGQITVIQEVLDARRKVSHELEKAVRSVSPAIWVATFALPGTFVGMYLLSQTARDFWFHGLISWIALGVVVFFYSLGMWIAKIMVDRVRNL